MKKYFTIEPGDVGSEAYTDKFVHHLIKALETIRDNGGKSEPEMGVSCNGSWCAEQARQALDQIGGAP